ncbi:MAG: JAB domain-containing protein [Sphingomonas sp.]
MATALHAPLSFSGDASAIITSNAMGVRIGDRHAAAKLFRELADHPRELVCLAYIDPQWMLLGLCEIESRLETSVNVPVKRIMADALHLDATNVVMAHNHPSGDPRPSDQDIATTRRIARALALIEVQLVDHLIIASNGVTSLRAMGLL